MSNLEHFKQYDQYLTRPHVAEQCWRLLHDHMDVPANAFYVEPSAGQRAFYNLMPPDSRVGYELDPELAGGFVKNEDYLELSPLDIPFPSHQPVFVVGNPPFGNGGDLARRFVKQSFDLGAACVAFIIPSSGVRKSSYWVETHRSPIDRQSFHFPNGNTAPVSGLHFVILRQPGEGVVARKQPTCEPFVAMRSICPGKGKYAQHAAEADMFLASAFFPSSKRPELAVTEAHNIKYGSGIAIYIMLEDEQEKERLKRKLLEIDWQMYAKQSANRSMRVGKEEMAEALAALGYVNE